MCYYALCHIRERDTSVCMGSKSIHNHFTISTLPLSGGVQQHRPAISGEKQQQQQQKTWFMLCFWPRKADLGVGRGGGGVAHVCLADLSRLEVGKALVNFPRACVEWTTFWRASFGWHQCPLRSVCVSSGGWRLLLKPLLSNRQNGYCLTPNDIHQAHQASSYWHCLRGFMEELFVQ